MRVLYNPSQSKLECEYIHSNGVVSLLSIDSLKTKKFNDTEAHFMENRLVYHTFFERGVKENPELDMEEIRKEINGSKDITN